MAFAERARHVTHMPQSLPQGVQLTVLETSIGALLASPPSWGPITTEGAVRRRLALLDRLGIGTVALSPFDRLSGGQRQLAAQAQTPRVERCSKGNPIILAGEPLRDNRRSRGVGGRA